MVRYFCRLPVLFNLLVAPLFPLTMHNAVEKALQHNPDLQALHSAERAKHLAANGELSAHLPKIALNSYISKEKGQNSVASTTSLDVDQLLFSLSGPFQRHQQAQQVAAIAGFDKQTRAHAIRFETERAFLQAWLSQEQEPLVQSINRAAAAEFTRQDKKHETGQLDDITWLGDVTVAGERLVTVENYPGDHAIAQQKLLFLMGDVPDVMIDDEASTKHQQQLVWQDKKNYRLEPLKNYIDSAFAHRPEVPRSLKAIALEKWNARLAYGQRAPTLSAGARVGFIVTPSTSGPALTSPATEILSQGSMKETDSFWSLSLSFNWPIFDGLVAHYREQQAHADRVKELCNRDKVMLNIKLEVQEKYVQLSKQLRLLQVHQVHYLRGYREFRAMEKRHEIGKISAAEWRLAQSSWCKAQYDWLERKVTVAVAEHELMWVCGYPEGC